jgi:hypothetical protein
VVAGVVVELKAEHLQDPEVGVDKTDLMESVQAARPELQEIPTVRP